MKHLLPFLLCWATLTGFSQPKYDLLFQHATLIDGSGRPGYQADLGIRQGKIAHIGNIPADSAMRVIDATGLTLTPGFIDVHTHIERFVLDFPAADNFVLDGVTTVITGNCGTSTVNFADFFKRLENKGISLNIASLAGHNSIRRVVMGTGARNPTPAELAKMEALLAQVMKEGAVGFSTGLIYTPGVYAKTPELVALAKIAARYGGVYATHMRDERDSVLAAIQEALSVARQAHIKLEISHFKVGGLNNAGKSTQMLQRIEQARNAGIDVMLDQYPYTASSTSLDVLLPDWVRADGDSAMVKRLRNPQIRHQILTDRLSLYQKRNQDHLNYAVVAYYPADTTLNGKSITSITEQRLNRSPTLSEELETVMDMLLQKKQGETAMVYHSFFEPDIEHIMQYPLTMVASDGSVTPFGRGVPHPRSYGTNARVLQRYVREKKVLTLEDAIRKMTSLPAQRFGLTERGLLKPGYQADLLLFDPNTLLEVATYDQPHAYTQGMVYVLVNGQLVVENGKPTHAKAGQVLRRKGSK